MNISARVRRSCNVYQARAPGVRAEMRLLGAARQIRDARLWVRPAPGINFDVFLSNFFKRVDLVDFVVLGEETTHTQLKQGASGEDRASHHALETRVVAPPVLAVEAAQHHRGVKNVFSGCASGIAARPVSSSTVAEAALISTRSLRTNEPRNDLDCRRDIPSRLLTL